MLPILDSARLQTPESDVVEGIATFYRLDETKALDWLSCKVNHIADRADSLAILAPYLSQFNSDDINAKRLVALQAVGQNLNDAWLNKLAQHMGLADDASSKIVYFENVISKKSSSQEKGQAPSRASKPTKMTRAHKALATAKKSGIKPLTSFFKPIAKSNSQQPIEICDEQVNAGESGMIDE
eukprot:jgi/Hompol1/5775/HPOL_002058-RA